MNAPGGDVLSAAARARLGEAPRAVSWIVERLESEGFETWAVGGAVRDAVLDLASGDWDFATAARPEDVRRVFRRTVPIGVDHGTIGVLRSGILYEVTTFRRDVEPLGRRAVVEFADTVEEDLARRDFTINALAWHPLRERLLDLHGGVEDLRAGVLRTVEDPAERFREDHLRILRALRFAGHFGLRIEEETWKALRESVARLPLLSAERIREELVKVLSGSERGSRALGLYALAGVLPVLYPELAPSLTRPHQAGARTESDAPEGTAWERAVLAVDALPRARWVLRLAAWLRAACPEAHGRPDPAPAAQVLTRLRFSNAQADAVARVLEAGAVPPTSATPGDLRRWLAGVPRERARDVLRLHLADARIDAARWRADPGAALTRVRAALGELRRHPPLSVGDLAIGGAELMRAGLAPGPAIGRVLRELLDEVLEDPERNEPGVLMERARHLIARETGASEPRAP